MIQSMTDQDAYTFFVGNFIFCHSNVPVRYTFINRRPTDRFTDKMFTGILDNIAGMENLTMSKDEIRYLEDMNLFTPEYLDFLKDYRFDPGQVNISMRDGQLSIGIEGPWAETIMWEVPILAICSESFFKDKPASTLDFIQRTKAKRRSLDNIRFIEFGTRRRRSSNFQEEAIRVLKYSPGFMGTSNVHYARLTGSACLGSQSHQLYSGMSAIYPVNKVNRYVLEQWADFYKGKLGYALTDTFTTDNFLANFDYKLARIFDGTRQDSGDVYVWADKILKHYRSLGIDPTTKTLLFSDGLDPEKCVDIQTAIQRQAKCCFGLGTNLSNDVLNEKPLQIVIKLTEIQVDQTWMPVVKLSDDPQKSSGNHEEIERVRKIISS